MADGKAASPANSADQEVALPTEIRQAIGRLPIEEREKVEVFIQTSAFRGPFPPPWMLHDYERHHPGFLAELMARAKQAQDHQESLDQQAVSGQIKYMSRGQILGYTIVVGAIAAATYCAFIGQWQVGIALGLTGLAPIIGHFLKNPFAEKEAAPPPPREQPPAKRDRRRK